jgi:hypothetical protein
MTYSKVKDKNNKELHRRVVEAEQALIDIEAAICNNIEFVDNTLLIQMSTVIPLLTHRIKT